MRTYRYLKLIFLFSLFFSIFCFSINAFAEPSVAVQQPVYVFGAVPEGQIIEHRFEISNRGAANLEIRSAQATCSCTSVKFDKRIAPGAQGLVQVRFNSEGYGGKYAQVRIRLSTNDPHTPVTELTLSGKVEQVYRLTPPIVRLEGPAGKVMKKTVIIRPEPDYAFDIIEAKAKKGQYLRFQLNKKFDGNHGYYQLEVEVQKETLGLYFDKILLTTNSPHKPSIPVAVFAKITG